MFIDASAAVGIILDEPDRELLWEKLKSKSRRTMSAIASYESAMAIRRVKKLSASEAYELVTEFQKKLRVNSVDIEARFAMEALNAFERYGKGHHKAQLNMGDCFSYACAKLLRVPLLCKGNDFIQTDIDIA